MEAMFLKHNLLKRSMPATLDQACGFPQVELAPTPHRLPAIALEILAPAVHSLIEVWQDFCHEVMTLRHHGKPLENELANAN